jgi:hypothetical protein
MKPRLSSLTIALLGIAAASTTLRAGETVAHGSGQTAAEVEDIGEITEAPPDNGMNGSKFRMNAGVRTQFTTNAELSGSHSSSDVIFFPAVEAGYSTGLGHGFAFDFTAIIEPGLYASHTDRSFIGYSAQTSLSWSPSPKAPRFFIGAEPYRFDNFERGGLITEAIGTMAGADWGYSFNNGKSFLFGGYTFENYFSNPTEDNRLSNRVVVGITEQLRPRLFAQLWYQYEYSSYHNVDRNDSKHAVTLSLIYQFNRHLFGTLGESFLDNNSTELHASYQAIMSSAGLSWQF